MGKGIELAREINPEHAALMENMRDQLLIVFLNRLGGEIEIPISEIDNTGEFLMTLAFDPMKKAFIFKTDKKP